MERALQRREEIDRVYSELKSCEIVVITLGLIQTWYDTKEHLYLNRMPSPWAMRAFPGRYTIRILDVDTSYALLKAAMEKLVTAGIGKILVTVSPVPLQKSFSGADATVANSYSKSVLRVCADHLYADFPQVDYFPSYEIVLSGGSNALIDDNVHVRDDVVEKVVEYMKELYVR